MSDTYATRLTRWVHDNLMSLPLIDEGWTEQAVRATHELGFVVPVPALRKAALLACQLVLLQSSIEEEPSDD